MKQLFIIPLLCFSACTTQTKKLSVAVPIPAGRLVTTNGLRMPDQLSEYRLGRYVDARDPLVMHEGHPIYRIESSAQWDLRPRNGSAPVKNAIVSKSNAAANDAAVAEANRQRAEARAMTEQTAALNERLAELNKAVGQTAEIAKENLAIKRDLAALRERLDSVDSQLRKEPPPASQQPSPSEDKW